MNKLDDVLTNRQMVYGSYEDKCIIIQDLKDRLRQTGTLWESLRPSQRESLDMIMSKIGRILTGNSDYPDNWIDIAGYAMLNVPEDSK